MADKTNIEQRIKQAKDLKESLEEKFEKVKGTPRGEEFKIQIEKLDGLIAHLEDELKK
ncbi:MAG: hypothetical protein IJL02_11400 [Methanobrevibacter sp.]|uniref:hypothetical protein n=1 Tax=Methanobrevibacter sp. TaxID=66852 RepID=UPI0025DB1429|nr:hypothetical protein [Methanobrevibacter sp.]MBQ6100451.1 hypothetical protein [Methanobrevibacter sp.]